MTGPPHAEPNAEQPRGRGSWRLACALIAGLTLLRVLYLVWLCPLELAADEAQYWDWSRRLELSYYTKGPGVAWLIAASVRWLGDVEWAVRLPAAVSIGLAMLATARLAFLAAGGGARGGASACAAVLAWCAIPAYHALALIMTIDAPYLACWCAAALAAWTLHRANLQGRAGVASWAGLGCALGVGFLFKYTILLLIPGLVLWWIGRARARLGFPRAAIGAVIAAACFAATAWPVFAWNHARGWPTARHLLGHLGLSETPQHIPTPAAKPWSFDPFHPLSFIGGQIGLVGPALVAMGLAVWIIRRSRAAREDDHAATLFAFCLAAPILVFYLAVSFVTDAEGNWPIAGYSTLLIPVALAAPGEIARWRAALTAWKANPARPRAGYLRRAPETPFQIAWHWSLVYGITAAIALSAMHLLDRLPLIGPLIPLHRMSGHRAWAAEVDALRTAARIPEAPEPILIADQYTRAALLAFYLPDHPAVSSATSSLGGRRSSYDDFADTRLDRPDALGKPAILVGATAQRWNAALILSGLEERAASPPAKHRVYFAASFDGLRPRGAPAQDPTAP